MQEILTNSENTSEYTTYLVISFLNLSHINRKIIIFLLRNTNVASNFVGEKENHMTLRRILRIFSKYPRMYRYVYKGCF